MMTREEFVTSPGESRAPDRKMQSGAADIAALLLGAMMAGAAVLVAMIFVM